MTVSPIRVEWLTVAGEPETWRSIGLTVSDAGHVPLFGTGLRIVPPGQDVSPGLVGWALSGVEATESIAGLPTEVVEPTPPAYAEHRLGAVELDHVVVVTDSLERSSSALAAATGCEQKRVREVGRVRQGFHRIGRGGLIVEVVEHRDDDRHVTGFWGLVINVEDLDAAHRLLGPDRMTAPKDAVQPGRRIATIRREVGLGTAVALMSRDPR